MYEVNTKKVIGRMAEMGYNNKSFAEALGISRETLRSYLKHPEKIPYEILSKMAHLLKCSRDEAMFLFFA